MDEVRTKLFLFAVTVLLLLAALTGCQKLKDLKIGGTFAGTITDKNGTPQGFVKVELVDVATNKLVMAQNSQDSGRFMFQDVPAGKYHIRISTLRGAYPDNPKVYVLGMGRTLDETIVVDPATLSTGALPGGR